MSYFNGFPSVPYYFGNEEDITVTQNISLYSEVIDQIKDNGSYYNYYTIKEGDRPDNVSYQLYGTPNLYWTLFLMNDHIREQGWPLTNREINQKAEADFPHTTLVTQENIATRFAVGQTVEGLVSGATGVVVGKRIDFGQIIVHTTDTFNSTEIISSVDDEGDAETATLTSVSEEYNSVHHYEDSNGDYVDVDPFSGDPAIYNTITFKDRYIAANDTLKEIKVLNPNTASQVNRAFKKSLRT